jgi:pSer/pThr/pTyr-binding forkhead associated (FHA) protein
LAALSSIGRALRNVVPIDDEFLSAEHALLTWREGGWWIEDMGSKNGTSVNGVRVIKAVPVNRGDTIEVGRVVLRLE